MADVKLLIPKIHRWEGGAKYTNDPTDPGGPTKYGITLATWKTVGADPDKDNDGDVDAEDIKLLTEADFDDIFTRVFWDKANADFIKNQSVAEAIVDWGYNAGMSVPIKTVQRYFNLIDDGRCGPKTIAAINSGSQELLHNHITDSRVNFYLKIIERKPSQVKYKNGWINRAMSYKFEE